MLTITYQITYVDYNYIQMRTVYTYAYTLVHIYKYVYRSMYTDMTQA